MDFTEKEEIAKRLREKGATLPCARCGKTEFIILNRIDLTSSANAKRDGGAYYSAPMAVVACENCAHIVLHSIGLLGLPLEFGGSKDG